MSRNFTALYQDVIFISEDKIEAETFAIITACNPLGRVLNQEANTDLTGDLKSQLEPESCQNLIGASPDKSHQEVSFLWQTDKSKAVELASQFLQNAIYWIENGELFLVPVKMSGEEVSMGKFRDFLEVE